MTKLLNRPLKVFTSYALLTLVISIPFYVLVIDFIWTKEMDENNWLTLQQIKRKLLTEHFNDSEIEHINYSWGGLQRGISLKKAVRNTIFKDSVYEATRPNLLEKGDAEERIRGLKSLVQLNGEPYILTIETNLEESDETFAAVAVVTLIFFIVLIVGFILLNRQIATKTWEPFYQTLRSLKSFELSKDSSISLTKSDIQEIQEMNESIIQLVNNNINAFQKQKAFTENASHELQTPIALLKSKLDLLQQKVLSPETVEILNSVQAPLARLSRINKNLLLLAKVENHQFNDNGRINIADYLENAIELFEDYLGEKQLNLSMDVESVLVRSNSFLLETLIQNLFSNAIRHTPNNGHIVISCKEKILQVKNTGIESLDKNQLFERFTTTTKEKVSSGLGLAIVREIAIKNNWKLNYHFKKGFHVFCVTF